MFVFLTALLLAPSAESLLAKYDAIMGPTNFDGRFSMTAHRDDDTERTYQMRVLKFGNDKMRIWFTEPASVKDQEILRQGNNLWIYMPNLKRAVRMASRDSFQGGDFNNADVLRVNYTLDYTPTLSEENGLWLLALQAKAEDAGYDHIKLYMDKKTEMPVKSEYFAAGGKMLRAAEFSDIKEFGTLKRPAKIVMKNMLAQKRYSIMLVHSYDTQVKPKAIQFVLDNLGR